MIDYKKLLIQAVLDNNVEEIKDFFAKYERRLYASDKREALVVAIRYCNVETVETLLDCGVILKKYVDDVFIKPFQGENTPINSADVKLLIGNIPLNSDGKLQENLKLLAQREAGILEKMMRYSIMDNCVHDRQIFDVLRQMGVSVKIEATSSDSYNGPIYLNMSNIARIVRVCNDVDLSAYIINNYFELERTDKINVFPSDFSNLDGQLNSRFFSEKLFPIFAEKTNMLEKVKKKEILSALADQNNISGIEYVLKQSGRSLNRNINTLYEYAKDKKDISPELMAYILEKHRQVAKKSTDNSELSLNKNSFSNKNKNPFSVDELRKVWSFRTREDGSVAITKYKGKSNNVVIPSVIGRKKVTAIGNGLNSICGTLETIELPETVQEISNRAFRGCKSLKTVKMPDGFAGIFSCGSSVYEVFADNRTLDCDSWKKIKIPDGVTEVRRGAFSGFRSLETIELPETLKEIGERAFANCKSLKTIAIPNGVEKIGGYAFSGCWSLETIELPETVQAIGRKAFKNCKSLKTIAIPNGLKEIGCKSLETIGPLKTVKEIGNSAFENCRFLKAIVIPNGVEKIGEDAFLSCWSLETIELPETVNAIGERAFENCTSLEEIVIPNGVEKIRNSAFWRCKSLKAMELPETVKEIGHRAFYNCQSLKTIAIPNGVEEIGNEAFSRCWSLETIELPETVNVIGEEAFANCKPLKAIVIPDGVEEIGYKAFSGCKSLETIELPETVKKIGWGAFENCKPLKAIVIPDGVEEIDRDTFSGCESLETIELPETVKEISNSAFRGCKSLKTVKMPDGFAGEPIFSCGSSVYEVFADNRTFDCDSWKKIKIPNGVTEVREVAFYEFQSLETIELPETVTKIGKWAFYNCKSLKAIAIPYGVEKIGQGAFSGCESLETIELPETVNVIGEEAFYNCKPLKAFVIPDGVEEIGYKAFSGCDKLEIIRR